MIEYTNIFLLLLTTVLFKKTVLKYVTNTSFFIVLLKCIETFNLYKIIILLFSSTNSMKGDANTVIAIMCR